VEEYVVSSGVKKYGKTHSGHGKFCRSVIKFFQENHLLPKLPQSPWGRETCPLPFMKFQSPERPTEALNFYSIGFIS